MRKSRHLRLFAVALSLILISLGSPLATKAKAVAGNISHAYHSNSAISAGNIVGLDPKRTDYVQAASSDDGARLIGVVVQKDDSLLAVDPSDTTVQVATSGTVSTLVSNLNGDIRVSDQIAVSPFKGIGMKSLPGTHVIGLAQTAFNSHSQGAITQQVTNRHGQKSNVQVGYVQLTIAVGTGNISSQDTGLNVLQKLAKALTGHTISTVRIVFSILVAMTGFAILVTLIYGAIYGSIIATGRNPLAKYAIFRTLALVIGMAVLTAGVVAATIFFLLR